MVPGGAAQNPVLVDKGEADIGLGMPPLLAAAARGEDPYTGLRMGSLRALAGNMSVNVFHLYVATDLSLARLTMDQIFSTRRPIRLAISRPGTADIWVLEKIMEYYGLCATGKTSDCTFAFLALPAASVREASEGRQLTLLAFSPQLLEYLARFGLGEGVIPAGTYPRAANAEEDVASATMGTTITVSARMPDDIAYLITATINDSADRVRKIHGSLADYDPSKGHLHLGVPLHRGAERYYREKGWLR